MNARFRFGHDAHYLLTAFDRYRAQHWSRHLSRGVNVLALMVAAYFVWSAWSGGVWHGAVVGVVIVLVLAASRTLTRRLSHARLSRMKGTGETYVLELSEQGLLAEGGGHSARIGWDRFDAAVCYEDGYLLVQGPRVFNWLPLCALAEGSRAEEVEALLIRKLGSRVRR